MEDIQIYSTKGVVIPVSPDKDDIRNYLEMRLDVDPKLEAISNNLRADIVKAILEKIIWYVSRTVLHFHSINDVPLPTIVCRLLLVFLNIGAIVGKVTIRQRRNMNR